MIIGRSGWRSRVAAIVLSDIVLLQKYIRCLVMADSRKPQFLHQPVLMRAVSAFHAALGWGRAGGDDADPQLLTHTSELRERYFAGELFRLRGPPVHVLPVRVECTGHAVALDPAVEQSSCCPGGLLRGKLGAHRTRGIIHHVHQTGARAAFFQPLMKTAIQLHQFTEMHLALPPLAIRPPLAMPPP